MFPIETISAKMLDYYAGRSDSLIIDVRDKEFLSKKPYPGSRQLSLQRADRRGAVSRRKNADLLLRQGRREHGGCKAFCPEGLPHPFRDRRFCGLSRKKSCNFRSNRVKVKRIIKKFRAYPAQRRKRMKYMFASDIHGSAYYCRKMLDAYREEQAGRLVLLGDLLYHGPRNDLPREYAPKEVIPMLNSLKSEIYAVRGNCESEVDQMVLDFPVMADYCILSIEGKTFYATHGHIYNQNNLPPLQNGDILIHGHTHVLTAEEKEHYILLNPGSVSIPKEGNPPTYAVLNEGVFTIKDFDGNIIREMRLP